MSNRFTRGWIESYLPDGLDGELIVRGTTFSETAGHIGRESGEPDFTFAVFDYVNRLDEGSQNLDSKLHTTFTLTPVR